MRNSKGQIIPFQQLSETKATLWLMDGRDQKKAVTCLNQSGISAVWGSGTATIMADDYYQAKAILTGASIKHKWA